MIQQRSTSLVPVPASVPALRRPAEYPSAAAEPGQGDILSALRCAVPLGIAFWVLLFVLVLA